MKMNQLKAQALSFFQRDTVLCISFGLVLASLFVVPPDKHYIGYVDFRVLALLFCLMVVVAGWQRTGAFYRLGLFFSEKAHTTRGITYIVVFLCFFTSMFVTNDVALITFVPFTITLFSMGRCEKKLIPVIVLETIAANLGSMLTPIGNPQNLYLFSVSGMSVEQFILHMLPLTTLSLLLIALLICAQRNEPFHLDLQVLHREIPAPILEHGSVKSPLFWASSLLFLLCLANVFHLISYLLVFAIVVAVIFLCDRTLFQVIDYSLLLTFICLFVLIGNIGQIVWVRQALEQTIGGREWLMGILTSQIISNVPATMLLSGFTNNYNALLWGVNIGGLGTMIASMASLISYKYYGTSTHAQKGSYVTVFTKYNLFLLLPLSAVAILFST